MYVLHNKEQKKIVCFAWGEKGRDVSPQGRSKWLFEIKEESGDTPRKADRSRMIKEGKQSPLKERNERTGAFPPCGYSTFKTGDGNKSSYRLYSVCDTQFIDAVQLCRNNTPGAGLPFLCRL